MAFKLVMSKFIDFLGEVNNMSIVNAINKIFAKSEPMLRLLRYLVLWFMQFNIQFVAKQVQGVGNSIVNPLPRGKWDEFFRLAPKCMKTQ